MNPRIRQLSIAADEARQRFYAASAFNIYGLDASARVLASMDYAKAQAEYVNAESNLRTAMAQEFNAQRLCDKAKQ